MIISISERKKKEKKDEGWTLLETIIVIAIVLLLTGTVGFAGMKYVERARIVSVRSELASLSLALDAYYLDCGRYPTQDQGLKALLERPVVEPVSKNWSGPYLNKDSYEDSWEHEYQYEVPGDGNMPYNLYSFGADGLPGGENADADIFSRDE